MHQDDKSIWDSYFGNETSDFLNSYSPEDTSPLTLDDIAYPQHLVPVDLFDLAQKKKLAMDSHYGCVNTMPGRAVEFLPKFTNQTDASQDDASRRSSTHTVFADSPRSMASGSISSPNAGCSRREAHMASEQRRRAVMKDCFDKLQQLLPPDEYRKPNKANLLQATVSYINRLKTIEKNLRLQLTQLSRQNAILAQQLGVRPTIPYMPESDGPAPIAPK